MRRLKSDISHRVRPRRSIFSTGWFRVVLGSGVAVVLGLLVGPSVAGWFGTDLPRSVRFLAPWSGGDSPRSPAPAPTRLEEPLARPGGGGVVETEGASPRMAARAAPPAAPPAAASAESGTPGPVYRIQVGAFLDHRNADRLAERLRGEGLTAVTSVLEQSRVVYRVLVVPPEAPASGTVDVPDDLVERLRGLGFAPEVTPEGAAVTAPVSLRVSVETSRRLREEGLSVRLKQEAGSAAYRVVRVGSYATNEEAAQGLALLAGRGLEGFVVRER